MLEHTKYNYWLSCITDNNMDKANIDQMAALGRILAGMTCTYWGHAGSLCITGCMGSRCPCMADILINIGCIMILMYIFHTLTDKAHMCLQKTKTYQFGILYILKLKSKLNSSAMCKLDMCY